MASPFLSSLFTFLLLLGDVTAMFPDGKPLSWVFGTTATPETLAKNHGFTEEVARGLDGDDVRVQLDEDAYTLYYRFESIRKLLSKPNYIYEVDNNDKEARHAFDDYVGMKTPGVQFEPGTKSLVDDHHAAKIARYIPIHWKSITGWTMWDKDQQFCDAFFQRNPQ